MSAVTRDNPVRAKLLEGGVVYGVMALVLVFRPYGLFTQVQPRKI